MIRKSPALVPVQISQKREKVRRKVAHGLQAVPAGRRLPNTQQVYPLDLFHAESDFESHAVRQLLERLDVSYISHGLPVRRALAQKRIRDAGGSGRIPFLKDRRTGLKLEGRETIIAYLEREFGGIPGSALGSPSNSDPLSLLAKALTRRREEIKWRLMGPVDEAKLLALDWKRAIRTTLESARELGGAFRGIYQDLAQDLGRSSPRSPPFKLAQSSK